MELSEPAVPSWRTVWLLYYLIHIAELGSGRQTFYEIFSFVRMHHAFSRRLVVGAGFATGLGR